MNDFEQASAVAEFVGSSDEFETNFTAYSLASANNLTVVAKEGIRCVIECTSYMCAMS